jgi:alpha-galactosidase
MKKVAISLSLMLTLISWPIIKINCLNDGLHKTPPMGWSSWNTFTDQITEDKIIGIADAIKRLDLDKYGYNTLTIDDLWNLEQRDPDTNQMLVNEKRFPSGMKFIGDYLHAKELKFGIYSDAGVKTCAGMSGSLGYEVQDLDQFLEWDIDYLKYDNCWPIQDKIHQMDILTSLTHIPSLYQDPSEQSRFDPMGEAILKAKDRKNITFELCLYGWGNVEEWGPRYGHLWRTSGDISDRWPSVLSNLDRNDESRFVQHQGPDIGWNYPDALFVGNGGMTDTEYRTMFALWVAVKSPLMLGSDLRTMKKSDESYKIITNEELLAVNQDPLGVQATCRKNCCSHGHFGGMYPSVTCLGFQKSWQIWSGPLSNGDWIVIVVNRYDHNVKIDFNWGQDAQVPDGIYTVRDLWTGEDLSKVNSSTSMWSGKLGFHDNWAFKLTSVILP